MGIRVRESQECSGGLAFMDFFNQTEVVASIDITFLFQFPKAGTCRIFSQAWYWSSASLCPLCMYC